MKPSILKILILLSCLFAYDSLFAQYTYQWQQGAEAAGLLQLDIESILADSEGSIYVADYNKGRLLKFSADGKLIKSIGARGSGDGQMYGPSDIAIAANGNLYVVDMENHRVQIFDKDGAFKGKFGSKGAGNGQFNRPNSLVIDSENNLFVVDGGNNRVQKFTQEGAFINSFSSKGAGNRKLFAPLSIAVDKQNNVYVKDLSDGTHKFSSDGTYLSTLPIRPAGLDFDALGNMYASGPEKDCACIDVYGADNTYLRRITGNGIAGNTAGVAFTSDGSLYVHDKVYLSKVKSDGSSVWKIGSSNEAGQFKYPLAVETDAQNNLLVADFSNTSVQKFSAEKVFLSRFGINPEAGDLKGPESMALDAQGNIYVASYHPGKIQVFSEQGVLRKEFGPFKMADGFDISLGGIGVDGEGNIYISEIDNQRIQKLSPDGQHLLYIGSKGEQDGQFILPWDITVDNGGNLFVADEGRNNIQKFNSKGEFLMKFGSPGAEVGQFNRPSDIAIDEEESIYVADRQNHRIQKFKANGEFILAFGTEGEGEGQFYKPDGIALDKQGNIYVADTYNHRIQKFKPAVVNGIEEYLAHPLLAYPNPASDIIHVDLPDSFHKISLTLVNTIGELIIKQDFSGTKQLNFKVQHLPKGLYIIEVIADSRVFRNKIIVH